MPRFDVPVYGMMSREEKNKTKMLREYAPLFDGRYGAYRKIRVHFCKCGMKFREANDIPISRCRRHELRLPYDTDYIPCVERIEWMPIKVRRQKSY